MPAKIKESLSGEESPERDFFLKIYRRMSLEVVTGGI